MDVVSAYIELGLRLGRHVDGLVDSYYGPPELAESVEQEPPREANDLAGDAARLREALDSAELDESRRRWLNGQLVGLETVARKLAGETIPYSDEVERRYGLRPRHVPEEEFEAAHRALAEVLPGNGSLAERFQAWRERDSLQGELLARVIETMAADLRERTAHLFELPEGESAEWDFVSDEPWAAYNYYLGGLRSRIAVNTDVPMSPTFLIQLVAHEAYPGHHTEHAWKEQALVRKRSLAEETILMIGTPQSLISEGIGEVAPEILLAGDQDAVAAEHLAAAGIEYDADTSRAIRGAWQPLDRVGGNVALMLHEDGAAVEEGRAYLLRWGLVSERRADQTMRFIIDPVWRSYVTTYADGHELCSGWVNGDAQRFRRLLTEQLSPADLLASAS